MRTPETKKHKQEVRRRYERARGKAKELLRRSHKREYKKILSRIMKGGKREK